MNVHSRVLASAVAAILVTSVGHTTELTAFALMPANTFSTGPTSGQFAGPGAGGNALPLVDKQPVQGFSAVLHGPTEHSFYVMPDNGFGTKGNSADALLRIYAVQPNFKTWNGKKIVGAGTVSPVDFHTGQSLPGFNPRSFISVRDPRHELGFPIVANMGNYPNDLNVAIAVDPQITERQLLTGSDLDTESVRRDRFGNLWFGDEFGPFLINTSPQGRVLRAEIPTPNVVPPGSTAAGALVRSPQNPYLGTDSPNLGSSRGFEGMAINPKGDKLYTLLEGTVTGDNSIDGTVNKNLRIDEFDIRTTSYTGRNWIYPLAADGTNIGDMTAVNDHQFLVLERNGATATSTSGVPFKKIYLADISGVPSGGFARKTELVDLMNIADPHDLNGDGNTLFTFPFVTIESVLILDKSTLLVINDNNYPGTGGRDLNSDNTEFLKLHLDTPLNVARFCDEDHHGGWDFGDDDGWQHR